MRIHPKVTRNAGLLALALSLGVAAHPQVPRQRYKPTPLNTKGELSGTVTDAATGRPIARAQVMVFSQGSGVLGGVMGGVLPVPIVGCPCGQWGGAGTLRYQTLSDAHGRFAIRGVAAGWYSVSAVTRGYAEKDFNVKRGGLGPNLFYLKPGRKRDNIHIRLPRQAVLTGRVVDEHGQPVPFAYVRAMRYGRSTWNHNKLLPVTATETDDRGEYRLFGLLPGRYYLEVRYQPGFDLASFSPGRVAKRFLMQDPTMPFGSLGSFSPMFFYPGTTNSASAKPVVVSAGQVRSGLDISVRPLTPAERAKLKPRPPRPRRGDCEESGTVSNAVTGQPLKRAWVFLGPANGAVQPPFFGKTSTDASGHFAFHALSCFVAEPLLAWKIGFAQKIVRFPLMHRPNRQGPSQLRWQINNVHFALVPTGVITGTITDASGAPAACVRVTLIGFGYPSHPRMWQYPMRETVTDDRGEYRFFQLPPGRYAVAAQLQFVVVVATPTAVRAASREPSGPAAAYSSPYVYFPHAAHLAKARTIYVAPGQVVKGIDFSVQRAATYSISGIVKGPALQAAGHGLGVGLVPAKSPYGLSPTLHEQPPNGSGKFRISGVTSGAYMLWATALLHRRWYAAWARMTVGHRNITGVALDPHLGWNIPVRLRVEGEPHGYFRYTISAQEEDTPLLSQTVTTEPMPAGNSSELKGLFPGHYIVRVGVRRGKPTPFRQRFPFHYVTRPPQNWYIKSARFGTQDVRTHLFGVKMRKPKGTLDVTVSWRGADLRGTVVDSQGEPAPYATVVLVPAKKADRAWWRSGYAQLYERNHFLLAGVPPGQYRLFAWDDVEWGAWFDPKFLKQQWEQGQVVTLSEGQTKTFRLRARQERVPALTPSQSSRGANFHRPPHTLPARQ